MVTLFRNIHQIRQSFIYLFIYLFCEVFNHIPHVGHEAELIRMWFRNDTDGTDHRRALASQKPGESTRFHHLFDGATHKLLVLERRRGARRFFCYRSSNLPQEHVVIVNPVHHDRTLNERAPKGRTLHDIIRGQSLGAGWLETDILFPISINTCGQKTASGSRNSHLTTSYPHS